MEWNEVLIAIASCGVAVLFKYDWRGFVSFSISLILITLLFNKIGKMIKARKEKQK